MNNFKKELFIILAALCVLVVIWFFLYTPKLKELSELKQTIACLQEKIDISISAVKKIRSLKDQIEDLEEDTKQLRIEERLKGQKGEQDIIEILTHAATVNEDIELGLLKAIEVKDKWLGFDLRLRFPSFFAVGRYIETLNNAPFILKVQHMDITKIKKESGQQLDVRLIIHAYKGG